MKRRRPVKRRSQARNEQRRPPLESRHFAEQHSPGFVPPTPAEVERNRTLAKISEETVKFVGEMTEDNRLVQAGEAIGALIDLRAGAVDVRGVRQEYQAAARAEVVRAADASRVLPRQPLGTLAQITKSVAAKYEIKQQVDEVLARLMDQVGKLFKQARVTDRQAHCWIVNELIDAGRLAVEPHAREGARVLGIAPNNFSERVKQAHQALRGRAGALEEAQRLVAMDAQARALIVRLTDPEYDHMIGPDNRKGGRSVRIDQGGPAARRGHMSGGRGTGTGDAGEKRR